MAAFGWAVFASLAFAKPEGSLGKAEALLGAGRAREAAAAASRHLDTDPSDGAARLLRARACIALRDLPGARADVDEALRRAPGWPQALAVRSLVLLAEGKTREAVDQARSAAEAGPREKWAAWALAKALLASGDTKGSLASLERATRLDPAWVSATIERGKVRERLGDREGALADYERALLLDPGNPSATSARDDLRDRGTDAGAVSTAAVPARPSPAAPGPLPVAVRPPSPPGTTAPAVPGSRPGTGFTAATPPMPAAATETEPLPPAPAPPAPGTLPPELLLLAAGGAPPPANVPPFLELRDLSAATWGGAASAAKETMRLVIGPMTPAEEKGFDETWSPLFRFPHEKLVDWLNALNPLLGQYLATRSAAAEAALGFDAAQLEAAAAAGAGDAASAAEAMQSAGLAGQLVASLVARLEATVREIEALGPPPDPEEERKRRHARHVAAFQLPSDFAFEGEWFFERGSTLRLRLIDGQPDGRVVVLYGQADPPEDERSKNMWTDELFTLGSPIGFDDRWPGVGYKLGELLPDGRLLLYTDNDGAAVDEIEVFRLTGESLERIQYWDAPNPLRPELPRIYGPYSASAARRAVSSGIAEVSREGRAAILKDAQGNLGPRFARWKQAESATWAGIVAGTLRGAGRPSTAGPPPSVAASAPEPPVAAPASDAEKKLADEKVAFHQANISVFERDVAAAQSAVAGAMDPGSSELLTRRLIWAKDALQREKDAVTTIRTGAFTRTRTDADAVNLTIMERQGRDQADYWSEVQRVLDHAPRLVAMAPESERAGLADFFHRQVSREAIASGDLGRIRRAASAIGTKVRGGLESSAASAELEAIDASESLAAVESVKKTCDTSLSVLSGFGGTGVATMYMGVTGYMEGGPTEAFKKAATTWSAAAAVASEAMDAYQKGVVESWEAYAADPGKVKVDEAAAGFAGAAWSAGQTAAFAGLMKVGSASLGAIVGGAAKGGPPARKVSFRDVVDEARFRQDQEGGRALVGAFRDKAAQLAAAGKTGAPRSEIQRLRAEAEGLYRSIKTDFHAKVQLNALARTGESKLVHAFNSFDRPAMARLKERVSQRMQAEGWSGQEYRTFSNSASKGKTGMDIDLGVVEPPRFVLSGGKQVPNPAHLLWRQTLTQRTPGGLVLRRNPHEYQKAGQRQLDAAFKEVYGRSPGQAFTKFTNTYDAEAYLDPAWLGNFYTPHAITGAVDRRWVQQAADVTGFKVSSLPREHPALGRYATLQEQCRGMVKDVDTKLKPYLKDAKNPEAAKHIASLREVMEKFAKNEIGPIEAEQRLNLLTGGEGIVGVADRFRVMLEGLAGKVK